MTDSRDDADADGSLTYRDAVEILRLVEASAFCGSLVLEVGDIRLSVRRTDAVSATDD